MLTAIETAPELISTVVAHSQNENNVSDLEILHRVRQIRSQWSIAERIDRRQAAQRRFSDLLATLKLECGAA